MKKTGFLLVLLGFVFLGCDNTNGYKKTEMYTVEQCMKFKKGDTIYTRQFYSIEKQVVEKNVVSLKILEIRQVGNDWYKSIVKYDDIRFQ